MYSTTTALIFGAWCIVHVAGDGYGHGISKSTHSSSDPIAHFNWAAKFFPIHCQDLYTPCNSTINCGASGRAALCQDADCAYDVDPSQSGAFGLHLVNTSARPYGEEDNSFFEEHFTAKLTSAAAEDRYDTFMDYSTVLYTRSLQNYVSEFDAASVPYVIVHWADDLAQDWYSLIVQVSTSVLVLELVSPECPYTNKTMIEDDLQRLPASVFTANNVTAITDAVPSILLPLAVSRATSDLSAMESFYTKDLLAAINHSSSSSSANSTKLMAFAPPGANVLVRAVQRPATSTSDGLSVLDLETIKNAAHSMSHSNNFCGVDKYYDDHYAIDFQSINLDSFKANFDASNRSYHVFGNCSETNVTGPGVNMYVVDPTGEVVQIDGKWIDCPDGGSGDALTDACSQGNCAPFVASDTCEAALEATCGTVRNGSTACSDCMYLNWEDLQISDCINADSVNFCFASR